MITLEILTTGPLALVEDLGRPGLGHLGVTRSGAADRGSHALANRLVANPSDRATIEVTLGGFSARVHGGDLAIAVTGADVGPMVDRVGFGNNSIRHVRDGGLISFGVPSTGLRSYLAVRGGIDVEPTLGSRSHDVLSGLGPPPLQPGAVLRVGAHAADFPELDLAPVAGLTAGPVDLRVVPGPHDDWVIDPDALTHGVWVVSDRGDRVGIRLSGHPLRQRWPGRQLPSEGVVRGSIQLPPNGCPVILGPDHPVTGGYPVIGVVLDRHVDAMAQLRPGQHVRLHWSRTRGPSDAAPW